MKELRIKKTAYPFRSSYSWKHDKGSKLLLDLSPFRKGGQGGFDATICFIIHYRYK